MYVPGPGTTTGAGARSFNAEAGEVVGRSRISQQRSPHETGENDRRLLRPHSRPRFKSPVRTWIPAPKAWRKSSIKMATPCLHDAPHCKSGRGRKSACLEPRPPSPLARKLDPHRHYDFSIGLRRTSFDEMDFSGVLALASALNCAGSFNLSAPRPARGTQRTSATRPWRPGKPAADQAGSPTAPCAGGSPSS